MPEPDLQHFSDAERFNALPKDVRLKYLATLSESEAERFLYDWEFWARPNQKLPPGDWRTWLVRAGRGYGKTRVGAETVRVWAQKYPRVNIAGPTASDARDVMVEGPSGILAVCPNSERPEYVASKRQLQWPNGAVSLIFSADEPERFRGPAHYKLWFDELAAWRYQEEAWDQAMFGLRMGDKPQVLVTTTPKPTKLIKQLSASPKTFLTRGTTYENRSNLADDFFADIITKYEGTRLGRQELNAELLEDNPGALWHLAQIDADRVLKAPRLVRVVVAIDPAVTSNEESDETGIVIAGRDDRSPAHFYVLDDRSLIASPDGWARKAVAAYADLHADRVVGEVNNGGDLVESVIRHVDPNISYKAVHASRGKLIRAEPVAALYEQHRVHHVGTFGPLEDQMCDYDPLVADKSPDRMDALVWAITELSESAGWGLIEYYQKMNARAGKKKEVTPGHGKATTTFGIGGPTDPTKAVDKK